MGDRNEVGGSFLIPQSGSLTLFNPTVHIEASGDKTTDPEYLSLPRLIPLLQTHLQNLQTLLGVPPSPSTSSISASPSSSFDGLTTFQLSTLLKRRTLENVNAALGGVEALGRLVKQNGEMRIGEKVQKDYLEAVAHLKEVSKPGPGLRPVPSSHLQVEDAQTDSYRCLWSSCRSFAPRRSPHSKPFNIPHPPLSSPRPPSSTPACSASSTLYVLPPLPQTQAPRTAISR
jgi:hypothetical protein